MILNKEDIVAAHRFFSGTEQANPSPERSDVILYLLVTNLARRMGCLDNLSFNETGVWGGGTFRSGLDNNASVCTFRLDLWEMQRRNKFRIEVKTVVRQNPDNTEAWIVEIHGRKMIVDLYSNDSVERFYVMASQRIVELAASAKT